MKVFWVTHFVQIREAWSLQISKIQIVGFVKIYILEKIGLFT